MPHLDEKTKADLLRSTMPHLRDARSKGTPSLGAGAIYPIELSEVQVDPFPIPPFWPRCYALDVGWNRTAALWMAWDRSTDTRYFYTEHYRGQAEPSIHAEAIRARGAWIPGVIDPGARGRSQEDGKKLISLYRQRGLKLIEAKNALEAGIYEVWQLLSTGRLKVFRTLQNWEAEYRLYRRDEKGAVVDEFDHLMDCGDEKTEVLTRNGWRFFTNVGYSDELATVDLETDQIEYQRPTKLIAKHYDGPMVCIEGRRMSACFTPNHRMVVYSRGSLKPEIRLAKNLTIWDKIKLTAKWTGEKRDVVEVFAHGKRHELDAKVWARLLGWWIAEGYAVNKPSILGRGYEVQISQCKPDRVAELRQLLSMTPWNWRRLKTAFMASDKWLWQQLSPIGKQPDRFVPRWVKDSSTDVIEAFVEAAVAGDGWIQNGKRSYATTSRILADDMQELLLKLGYSGNVRLGRSSGVMTMRGSTYKTREQFWIQEAHTENGHLRDSRNKPNFSNQPYSGMVYCATVPNGTLVVRRNGKPMITGNCMRYLILSGHGVARVQPAKHRNMVGSAGGSDNRAGI